MLLLLSVAAAGLGVHRTDHQISAVTAQDPTAGQELMPAPPAQQGAGEEHITAFIIVNETRWSDDRVQLLKRLGVDEVIRMDPVYTDLACVDKSRGATGCALAHQAVWKRIAELGRRALVLEGDFSIGDQIESEVAAKLRDSFLRSEDYTSVGYCGLPPGSCKNRGYCGGDTIPGPLQCTTGYFMNHPVAERLTHYNVCSHPGKERGKAPPIDWYLDFACKKHEITCWWAVGPAQMPGHYGQGIFQQDEGVVGMHGVGHVPADAPKHPKGLRQSDWDMDKVEAWFIENPQEAAAMHMLLSRSS